MIFNVMSRNHDDHTKNFSFLMDKTGKWSFAPAYDLCYSYTPGGRWTNQHQMSVNGKVSNFTINDLLTVGKNMGIRECKPIIEQICETIAGWPSYARHGGVRKEHSEMIEKNLILLS